MPAPNMAVMGKKYVAAEKSNGPVCAKESAVAPGKARKGKLGAKMVVDAASAKRPNRTAHKDRDRVVGQQPLGCKCRTDASSMKLPRVLDCRERRKLGRVGGGGPSSLGIVVALVRSMVEKEGYL